MYFKSSNFSGELLEKELSFILLCKIAFFFFLSNSNFISFILSFKIFSFGYFNCIFSKSNNASSYFPKVRFAHPRL